MNKLSIGQQEFINKLLQSFEKEQIPWRSTWDRTITKAYNASSNLEYRGTNQLNLFITSLEAGYDDPRWMTFKQANEAGYRIKKGSVGTFIANYALKNVETGEIVDRKTYNLLSEEEKESINLVCKHYKVFNAQQIDGIPALDIKTKEIVFENEKAAQFAEALQKNMKVDILHQGDQAYYLPKTDQIVLPDADKFMDEQAYYAVRFHESAHATSNEERMDRAISGDKNSREYAIEELRAELTSAFLTLDIGFHFDDFHESNHQAYIQSWKSMITDDPSIVFQAINDALKIKEYILDKGEYKKIYLMNETYIKLNGLMNDIEQNSLTVDQMDKKITELFPDAFITGKSTNEAYFKEESIEKYIKNSNGYYFKITTGPGDIFGANHSHEGTDITLVQGFENKDYILYSESELQIEELKCLKEDLSNQKEVKENTDFDSFKPLLIHTLDKSVPVDQTFIDKIVNGLWQEAKQLKHEEAAYFDISPYGGLDVPIHPLTEHFLDILDDFKEYPQIISAGESSIANEPGQKEYLEKAIANCKREIYYVDHKDFFVNNIEFGGDMNYYEERYEYNIDTLNYYEGLLKLEKPKPKIVEQNIEIVESEHKILEEDEIKLFHGSPNNFSEFEFSRIGQNNTVNGFGFYFASSKELASNYCGNDNGFIYEALLSPGKELNYDTISLTKEDIKSVIDQLSDEQQEDLFSYWDEDSLSGKEKLINALLENSNDVEIVGDLVNQTHDVESILTAFSNNGYTHSVKEYETEKEYIVIAKDALKIKEVIDLQKIQEIDIFKSDTQVIVNPVNLKGVMGAGLAKKFKENYPNMFDDYRNSCLDGSFKAGDIQLYKGNEKWILNLPTKYDYKDAKASVELIEKGLKRLSDECESLNIKSITFPKIGCGLGGLDWNQDVLPLMHQTLDQTDMEIHVIGEDYEKIQVENDHEQLEFNPPDAKEESTGERNTVVINLFGGPGAGKTTCAWEIASELKKLNYVTEYVPEYAKDLVWDNRMDLLDGSIENQKHILSEQSHRIDRLNGKVDFIVTDAPSLLNLNYLKETDADLINTYKKDVLTQFKEHNNFNLIIKRGDTYETEGRIHTQAEAIGLDKSIKAILDENHMYYGVYEHDDISKVIQNCVKTFERSNNQQSKASNEITHEEISLDEMKNSISIAEYARDVLSMGLVKESRGLIRLEEHDSCKIYPNNTFYRYSNGIGGSIIDFIKHFEECDTKEAIKKMKEYYMQYHPASRFDFHSKHEVHTFNKSEGLVVPEKADTNKHVYAYLTKTRGIKPSVVKEYIDRKILYEDTNRNCVFVGKHDKNIFYANVRGTGSKSFKQDVSGSIKEVGIYVDNHADTLIVNEAVIDQMSYMSMTPEPNAYDYLSVCGASNAVSALRFHMLKRNESELRLKRVIVGLDNDQAGEENALKVINYLKENYPEVEALVHMPTEKDFNEQLKTELDMLSSTAPSQSEELAIAN